MTDGTYIFPTAVPTRPNQQKAHLYLVLFLHSSGWQEAAWLVGYSVQCRAKKYLLVGYRAVVPYRLGGYRVRCESSCCQNRNIPQTAMYVLTPAVLFSFFPPGILWLLLSIGACAGCSLVKVPLPYSVQLLPPPRTKDPLSLY